MHIPSKNYEILQDIIGFFSKFKVKDFKKRELDLRATLEINIAALYIVYNNAYDTVKQWEVSQLTMTMDEVKNIKARGPTIRVRVKWQVVGNIFSSWL